MLLATLCTVSVVNIQYTVNTLGYFVVAHKAMMGWFCTHFVLNSPQENLLGLGLNMVFNNTTTPYSWKRHVRRPAVLKPLPGHVTRACPHTASAQSYKHIYPPSHLYSIPSQLVQYNISNFGVEPLFDQTVKCIQHSALIMRHLLRLVCAGVVYREELQA